MEKLQTDMASFGVAMKKQGEDTAAALKAVNASLASFAVNQTTMCENLKSFSSWMPTVEGSLHALQLSLAEVGERVAVLESALSSDDDETPRPDGHREDHHPQGIVSRASKAMAPALGKVDAALSLAETQEELSEESRPYSPPSRYRSNYQSAYTRTGFPGKGILSHKTEDKDKGDNKPQWQNKFQLLKAQRRERGECFKCGDKYQPGHKCSKSVPLNLVEELVEILQLSVVDSEGEESEGNSSSEETFMHVSLGAMGGTVKKKSLRLQGTIRDKQVLILVDSGSFGNFISSAAVEQLGLPTVDIDPVTVTVANGAREQVCMAVVDVPWECQGATFTTSFRVFDLPSYDIIVGMDWLDTLGPMWMDWKKKIFRIKQNGKRITIKGVQDKTSSCAFISPEELQQLEHDMAILHVVQLSSVTIDPTKQDLPEEIAQVLKEHESCFGTPKGLPPHRPYDHKINLMQGVQPVNVRPYRYSPQQKDEIEKQIKEMLVQGIIKESKSPFASPVLLVKKKDGSWRFCIDYRQLNAVTVKDRYPMPVVEELLDELAGAKFFTKLDLRSGFHQIRMVPHDESKTAFRTHNGHYEFLVMPFGLSCAPATFQAAMNTVFAHIIRKYVLVFVDDILVYSTTIQEHKKHLETVLQLLEQNKLYVKRSKCSFAQQSLEYLGHIISAEGVSTDPTKIEAVQHWPQPTSLTQLRGFLGLAGYYRKFIRHFGIISRPLTDLLKKNKAFVWSPVVHDAFLSLKTALVQAPVLALPDFTKDFVLEADACATGVGAVLMQQGHPLAFLSKALGPRNQALSVYDKECLAILLAIDKWRSYLQHRQFTIHTDQRSLVHLGEHKFSTPIQQKAFFKLMGLQYRVVYKKGVTNRAADALSRRPHNTETMAISAVQPRWIESVIEGYQADPKAQELLTELAITQTNDQGYSLHKGVIRHKGRVWLGTQHQAHQAVLLAFHHSALGGHSGILPTYQKIKKLFSWPGMKESVHKFVQSCTVCQQAKSEHVRYPGKLQPLPIPKEAWHTVGMDFIEGLPVSNKFDTILVVVDKLTKFGHFIPLKHPFTASTVAQAFFDTVYRLHGLPQTAPMAASQCAATAGRDKKVKVPKKLLKPEDKFIQAAKQWDRHTIFKLKQT
ncbi:hypothetical protein QYE76_009811 [Lolium multiflorum]|uniref:Reverse transcriptase domain-containing protein n=1 Tax=Lolium multiflorum TaxID=4521 RepID=A0AAD8TW10_LOLMU|nr:hypothetical protein QYE76_009811 [Lolium multiflorum]